MRYTLYDNEKWLGAIPPRFGTRKGTDKYNAQKGKVRVASLTSLFGGKNGDPKKAISDIGRLLASGMDFRRSVVTSFKHLKKLLAKAKGKVTMVNIMRFDAWYAAKAGKLRPLDLSPNEGDWKDDD